MGLGPGLVCTSQGPGRGVLGGLGDPRERTALPRPVSLTEKWGRAGVTPGSSGPGCGKPPPQEMSLRAQCQRPPSPTPPPGWSRQARGTDAARPPQTRAWTRRGPPPPLTQPEPPPAVPCRRADQGTGASPSGWPSCGARAGPGPGSSFPSPPIPGRQPPPRPVPAHSEPRLQSPSLDSRPTRPGADLGTHTPSQPPRLCSPAPARTPFRAASADLRPRPRAPLPRARALCPQIRARAWSAAPARRAACRGAARAASARPTARGSRRACRSAARTAPPTATSASCAPRAAAATRTCASCTRDAAAVRGGGAGGRGGA